MANGLDPRRVLLLTLEYADPIFSGNGVLGRSLVSALLDSGHEVTVVCGRPAQESDARCGEGWGEYDDQPSLRVLSVPLPVWYKLDRSSSWERFARLAALAFGIGRAALPDVVIGVDWTGHHAFQHMVDAGVFGEELPPPFIFYNFRVFSASSGGGDDHLFYEHMEAQAVLSAATTVVLCANDGDHLRRLAQNAAADTGGEGGEGGEGDDDGTEGGACLQRRSNVHPELPFLICHPPLRPDIRVLAEEEMHTSKAPEELEEKVNATKTTNETVIVSCDGDRTIGDRTIGDRTIVRGGGEPTWTAPSPPPNTSRTSRKRRRHLITCCARIVPEKNVRMFVDLMIKSKDLLRDLYPLPCWLRGARPRVRRGRARSPPLGVPSPTRARYWRRGRQRRR